MRRIRGIEGLDIGFEEIVEADNVGKMALLGKGLQAWTKWKQRIL